MTFHAQEFRYDTNNTAKGNCNSVDSTLRVLTICRLHKYHIIKRTNLSERWIILIHALLLMNNHPHQKLGNETNFYFNQNTSLSKSSTYLKI